jgi:hypothetical protein
MILAAWLSTTSEAAAGFVPSRSGAGPSRASLPFLVKSPKSVLGARSHFWLAYRSEFSEIAEYLLARLMSEDAVPALALPQTAVDAGAGGEAAWPPTRVNFPVRNGPPIYYPRVGLAQGPPLSGAAGTGPVERPSVPQAGLLGEDAVASTQMIALLVAEDQAHMVTPFVSRLFRPPRRLSAGMGSR